MASLIPKGNSVTRISPSHFACVFPFPLEVGKVLLEAGRIDHPHGRMDERFVKNAVLVGLERASCDLNLHPLNPAIIILAFGSEIETLMRRHATCLT